MYRLETLIGVILNGTIQRAKIIGNVSSITNKILIQRECDKKIFAVSCNLVAWVNTGDIN